MLQKICLAALATLLVQSDAARATSVEIDVRDQNGRAIQGAVVSLLPVRTTAPLPDSSIPLASTIDQQHETFLPPVTLIRKGGHVVFTNHDTTMHQVYSFSAIKQFAFEIDQGQRSAAVVFDKEGVAAVGCNIHDHMIAYVYVAESPWTALTDAQGQAKFEAPAGSYSATIWHPDLPPGTSTPVAPIAVSKTPNWVSVKISLSEIPPRNHVHMQMY